MDKISSIRCKIKKKRVWVNEWNISTFDTLGEMVLVFKIYIFCRKAVFNSLLGNGRPEWLLQSQCGVPKHWSAIKNEQRPFPTWNCRMAHSNKGRENKKGLSAIWEVVSQEYTISIYKCIYRVGFKKCASRHSKAFRSLPWRRWELQMCTLLPSSIKPSGSKE